MTLSQSGILKRSSSSAFAWHVLSSTSNKYYGKGEGEEGRLEGDREDGTEEEGKRQRNQ